MLLGHWEAASLVSLAGSGVLFVLGLAFFFLFKISVQKPVFKFCFYNCVFGRNFHRMISGMLGVTNWYK